jgi:hypothetical protein
MCKCQILVLQPDVISHSVLLSWYLISCLVERLFGDCPPSVSLFLSLTDGLILGLDLDAGQIGDVTEHGL